MDKYLSEITKLNEEINEMLESKKELIQVQDDIDKRKSNINKKDREIKYYKNYIQDLDINIKNYKAGRVVSIILTLVGIGCLSIDSVAVVIIIMSLSGFLISSSSLKNARCEKQEKQACLVAEDNEELVKEKNELLSLTKNNKNILQDIKNLDDKLNNASSILDDLKYRREIVINEIIKKNEIEDEINQKYDSDNLVLRRIK